MSIKWEWKLLDEMTPREVYMMLQHRGKIFAVEQNQAYLDADGDDLDAWHMLGLGKDNALIIYARVLLPTFSNSSIRFGRLSIAMEYRSQGYANQAVQQIFSRIENIIYNKAHIQISANTGLIKMYEKFGFYTSGDVFNMGSLPHIKMYHNPLK